MPWTSKRAFLSTRFSPLHSLLSAGFTPQELTVFSIEAAKAIIGEPEQSGRIVLLVMRRNESRSNQFNLVAGDYGIEIDRKLAPSFLLLATVVLRR